MYAPFGLEDVVAMHMCPHRVIAPAQIYEDKVRSYRERWPSLTAERW
ncbi:hypothetical protein GCM10022199_20610 [Marihabitans asiaticum]